MSALTDQILKICTDANRGYQRQFAIERCARARNAIEAKLKGEGALTFTHTLKSLDADLDYVERQLKAMK